MSYDALYFAAFLALTLAAARLLPWKGPVLLVASIAFYSVAGLRDTVVAAGLILANFGFQFLILRNRNWLYPALALNFGCLAWFKYRIFLTTLPGQDLYTLPIVIPLGISFYVFQLSGFLIDLSQGRSRPFRSLPRFALFKLFFGQLIAGPITRARQFGPQIDRLFDGVLARRRLFGLALGLFLLGLTKKIVFADSLAPFADAAFRQGPADAAGAWLGLWLFTFQIYFDFSGYSDMAVAIALMFGMRLPVNFRQPYLAANPQDFWRRWHITLSTWIRDYLYIPLGGSRGSAAAAAVALVVSMALAGLWHGAQWTFVIWGIGWALLTLAWRASRPWLENRRLIAWALTFVSVMLLWVFFRAPDLGSALRYLGALFGGSAAGTFAAPDGWLGILTLAGCIALLVLHWAEAMLFSQRVVLAFRRWDGPFLRSLLVASGLVLYLMPKLNDDPFIYFRF